MYEVALLTVSTVLISYTTWNTCCGELAILILRVSLLRS